MDQTVAEIKGNGSNDDKVQPGPVQPEPVQVAQEIRLERVDVLEVQVLQERSRRIESEKARIEAQMIILQREGDELQERFRTQTVALGEKYGFNVETSAINLETGLVTPRRQ